MQSRVNNIAQFTHGRERLLDKKGAVVDKVLNQIVLLIPAGQDEFSVRFACFDFSVEVNFLE